MFVIHYSQLFHVKHPSIQYHTVSRETFSAVDTVIDTYRRPLSTYLDQLLWWNKRINVVSRDVSRETIREHIRHSLLLSGFPDFQEAETVVDAGTGGGLPGIPLAITHPEKQFILNDIVTKKCLAVKQIAKKLALNNVEIIDGSVENLQLESPFLLLSKHAFKIDDLWKMTGRLPWSKMIFLKGLDFDEELAGMEESSATVTAYDLYEESRDPFYKDKAIVIVERENPPVL